jgi:hypothetical protein
VGWSRYAALTGNGVKWIDMLAILVFLVSLFIPLVSSQTAPLEPEVDPAVVRYAGEIAVLADEFRAVAGQMQALVLAMAQNPALIGDETHWEKVRDVVRGLRALRERLDEIRSPTQVEGIHQQLEEAGDLIVLGSFLLERFAAEHDLDDFYDASRALVAGLAIWQETMNDLRTLTEPAGP